MTRDKHTQKQEQMDDLSYLSSVAFNTYGFDEKDLHTLTSKIDAKSNQKKQSPIMTIFISVLCGLLIGFTIFFMWFQKNKTHQSVYQNLLQEKAILSLDNSVNEADTLFPIITAIESKAIHEHFHASAQNTVPDAIIEFPDVLTPITTTATTTQQNKPDNELKFRFIPNAPVIFIHNLKVTNYRLYYFKNNQSFSVDENSGVSAQYENASQIEREYLTKSDSYLAHKIIQRAMKLFANNKFVNCIEELTLIYNYNPNDVNAQFYLGMCYYQLYKFEHAKSYFMKVTNNDNNIFHQESEFYLALCLLNTNQKDKALEQLQTIAKNNGFYSERAKMELAK